MRRILLIELYEDGTKAIVGDGEEASHFVPPSYRIEVETPGGGWIVAEHDDYAAHKSRKSQRTKVKP